MRPFFSNTTKDLEMSGAGHLTWLVKIPKFLSERWQEQAQLGGTGADLGVMRVHEELSLWTLFFFFFFSEPELPDMVVALI
jgi:hypothetical protein